MKKHILAAFGLLSFSPVLAQSTQTGTGGAAATADVRSTKAALEVLRSGGNAVDAAVAAAAVFNVTDPFSAGIGGGGFMVIYNAKSGKVTTIDSREKAPSAATAAWFNGANGQALPFGERVSSGLSVGVPGTVAGWDLALRRYGSRSMASLLQPAIAVAQNGFDADATYVAQVEANRTRFGWFPATAKLYLTADGKSPTVGSIIKNPDLAQTFRYLAAGGSKWFYNGTIAREISQNVQRPPSIVNPSQPIRGAPLTETDMASYQALERAPTVSTYRGHTIYGMGSPSSGGLTIGLALNLLEGFDLAAMPRERAMHLYLEASRLGFADRGAFMGDADFVDVPAKGLLSKAYAEERRKLLTDRAVENPAVGNPRPFNLSAYLPDPLALFSSGEPPAQLRETTHITTADAMGNIVSYTFTIETVGGSGIVLPGRGFLLNNELTDFDAVPNIFNSPAANKRPRSSMSPTIIFKDGKPLHALGSPGGATIITTVLQTTLNLLDFGMKLPEAINAPRYSQRNTANTSVEAGADTALLQALSARGHKFAAPAEIGAATGISFNADGSLTAAAEAVRRGSGVAGVVNPK
jgi:gamma-glutamyltranspeptidase / glutathione hydrolase